MYHYIIDHQLMPQERKSSELAQEYPLKLYMGPGSWLSESMLGEMRKLLSEITQQIIILIINRGSSID